jgi:hypothetical protein
MSHPSKSGKNHPQKGKTGKHPRKSHSSRANLLSFTNNFSWQQRQMSPFPPKMTRDMIWSESFSLTTPTSQAVFSTQHLLKLNSLNQPDASATHKPYAWVEMSALYDRYISHATNVEFVFQVASGSKALAMGFVVLPSSSSYGIGAEAVTSVLENQMGDVLFCNATGWTTRKRFTLAMHVIEGLSKVQYDAELDDYSGSTQSGNPLKTPYLLVALANTTDNTAVGVNIIVKMKFRATFYGRTVQAPD